MSLHRRRNAVAFFAILALVVLIALVGTAPAVGDLVSRPSIEGESVSHITPTDATLEAQINPGGLQTTWEVALETQGCIEEKLVPVYPCEYVGTGEVVGSIPAGSSTETVSIDIATAWHKLRPGTPYLYSMRAANSVGKVFGPETDFTTPSSTAPSIEGESVSHITQTDATLEAQINPGGLETTYEVALETQGCIEEKLVPVYPCEYVGTGEVVGSIPAGSSTETVSIDIATAWHKLRPGTPYIYSMHATNADGKASGNPIYFSTPSWSRRLHRRHRGRLN